MGQWWLITWDTNTFKSGSLNQFAFGSIFGIFNMLISTGTKVKAFELVGFEIVHLLAFSLEYYRGQSLENTSWCPFRRKSCRPSHFEVFLIPYYSPFTICYSKERCISFLKAFREVFRLETVHQVSIRWKGICGIHILFSSCCLGRVTWTILGKSTCPKLTSTQSFL